MWRVRSGGTACAFRPRWEVIIRGQCAVRRAVAYVCCGWKQARSHFCIVAKYNIPVGVNTLGLTGGQFMRSAGASMRDYPLLLP